MTKDKARKILESGLFIPPLTLPICDKIVKTIDRKTKNGRVINQYTFKQLIKIAYDLEDKK